MSNENNFHKFERNLKNHLKFSKTTHQIEVKVKRKFK